MAQPRSIRRFALKPRSRLPGAGGFALVVTLSLMILLTLIAVGLLTLSSISLRASSQGEAMATARANARLALMLAIGDLQKSLGPDRAVSATSEILAATPAKPHTTGVWESWWDFNPGGSSLNYSAEKKNRFRRWLVSHPDPAAQERWDFTLETDWQCKTIELVGDNALGGKAATAAKVVAGRVPVVRDGKAAGAFAWHVADEAAKARINLYRDPAQNTTVAQQRALLAGQRPDPSVMTLADGGLLDRLPADTDPAAFKNAMDTSGKLIDLDQMDLYGTAMGKIKPLRHDLTPWSLGVLSDVRRGSLKQDLSSVFEMSTASVTKLPSEFSDKKLYASTHGITGVSDPYWSSLAGYYNIFRNITNSELNPTFSKAPVQDVPLTTPAQPTSYYPGPVIAKVEILYNLVVSDADPYWGQLLQAVDPKLIYKGFLIYTPLVTLHNPYNINLSFDRMDVIFRNVPMAFRFCVNGQPQTKDLVPTDEFYVPSQRHEKVFAMAIGNWTSYGAISSPPTTKIIMKPGQTLVCGPYYNPSGVANDWLNDQTGTVMKSKPGFRGRCGGFLADCIAPAGYDGPPAVSTDGVGQIFGLRAADMVHMDFAMKKPSYDPNGANGEFQVSAKLYSGSTSKNYGGLSFKYNPATLSQLFPMTYRYPRDGAMPATEFYVPPNAPISQFALAKTVAIFSAYARTANGGVYETGKRTETAGSLNTLLDGRLAGKPFLFHNPARTVITMDLSTHKSGVESYELNLQPLPGHVDDILPIDSQNRSPAISANTETRGLKSAAYLELPTGPLQTIADFRRSNALTSPYPPNFVLPVGNSLASPVMSTDMVKQTDSQVSATELLDHSVLANHALYDRFYFSTFATRGSETPDTVFGKFMNGTTPLPSQAFQPYRPGGKSVAAIKAELFASGKPKDDAYKSAAEYQMIQGPFNVNSTSVQAWKAVLASMNKSEVVTLWAKTNTIELKQAAGVPILGMSLLNGGVTGGTADLTKIDDAKTNDWNGHRELTNKELETLATQIVDQVRTRGPFLSMSEFVNRQVGPNGPLTRCGALEAAIGSIAASENYEDLNKNFFKTNPPGAKVTDIATTDISDASLYKYNTPEVVTGNPAAGAPGWISQGDLLRILEPAATVRGDTFVIRVCGEAWDPNGKVTARAYAEAVVQRMPEYVDPVDRPSLNAYTDPKAAKANKTFGRRINLVSFRWLSGNEI
jgi:hypothetical protein